MPDTPPAPDRQEPELLAPVPDTKISIGKRIRHLFFGRPLSSDKMEHTLLSKIVALPVFASDAISSVAYASQEIVLALGAAGLTAVAVANGQPDLARRAQFGQYTMLISGMIVALLVIVVISYWQTIFGYPGGGGSYIVSKDNLRSKRFGELPGLIAAAALLIDYVLTVSVSIAAGVQNLPHIPFLPDGSVKQHTVLICSLLIAVLVLANMRGLKESGTLFAIPTYIFVVMCYIMIAAGLFGPMLFGWKFSVDYNPETWGVVKSGETFGFFVLAKAFANGCSAMTGTEAVSNGIPAFKEPKSRNAALTLVAMGVILGTLFIGISYLAVKIGVVYPEGGNAPAVIDQISTAIFGKTGRFAFAYYITQIFTAGILILAANTSFADFPRLSSILARDRYLPKQFSNLGDKLVFSNGILILGIFAAALIVLKKGDTDALVPLYAVGVFLAFTLSQSGMVVHWFKLKETDKKWLTKAIINGVGAVATLAVLVDITIEKWKSGAWFVVLLIIMLVMMFRKIHRHYADVAQQLRLADYVSPTAPLTNTVLVLVPTLHRGIMPALEYARAISPDCRAVHISTDPEKTPQLKEKWEQWGGDMPLVILNSPYRSLVSPIMRYLDAVGMERRSHTITVVVPEFVPTKWWHPALHGNSGLRLKIALLGRRDVVVANVRYYLQHLHEKASDAALREEEAEEANVHGHTADHAADNNVPQEQDGDGGTQP